jgi:hypothetical protein
MIKRGLIHIFVLFISASVLILAACSGGKDPKKEFYIPQNSDSGSEDSEPDKESPGDSAAETFEAAFTPTWIQMNQNDVPYSHAKVFSSAFGASFSDTGDSILYGALPTSLTFVLMEYVKSTGQVVPFCKLAACSHTNNDCPAGGFVGNIDFRNGRTAVLRRKSGSVSGFGGFISELTDGRFEFVAGPFQGFVMGDDAYYVITPDASLARIAFGSGETEIILDEFGWIKPVVIGDYLYACGLDEIVRVNIRGSSFETKAEIVIDDIVSSYTTDGKHLYYEALNDGGIALFRCNLDGENAELVLKEPIYAPYISFDDTYIYFSTFNAEIENLPTNGNIYRYRLDLTGEKELLCETGARYPSVYTLPTSPDTLLVEAAIGETNRAYYFLPKNGGSLVKIGGD